MLQTPERILMLDRMKNYNLDVKLARSFSLSELTAACGRIEENAQFRTAFGTCSEEIQKELIRDTDFCGYYSCFTENRINDLTVEEWLDEAAQRDEILTKAGTIPEYLALAASGIHSRARQYDCLRFFRNDISDPDKLKTLADNLNALSSRWPSLSDLEPAERELLRLPFFHAYLDLHSYGFQDEMRRLAANSALQSALSYLYAEGVELKLEGKDLIRLEWLRPDDAELFALAFTALGSDSGSMGKLIGRWLENGAPRYDLEWFANRCEPIPREEQADVLDTRLGYLNTLYSGKLRVPFDSLQDWQSGVLIYAIAQRKRHFLSLVNENFETFSALDRYALLLQEDFYRRCDLNAFTLRDLKACEGQRGRLIHLQYLSPGTYTFQELKLMAYAKETYFALYDLLTELRVDDRLIVMRELLKKDLLPEDTTLEHIRQLAVCFRQKPFHTWREQELRHIQGLSAYDAVRILRVYDRIERFLPDVQSWEEAAFMSRNADRLQGYATWTQAREDMLILDQDWLYLAKEMKFSDEFITENRQGVLHFLLNEGAEMSRTFYDCTDREDAFRRIVQAELLGRFHTLKYFPDDLEKEISYPVDQEQQRCWQENTSRRAEQLTASEEDDFYTTLRLGELPRATCLSYRTGMHRDCLLSGYDSNKKILLARRGDKVVGRAVIRLTKGTFYAPEQEKSVSLQFADLSQDRPKEEEPLAQTREYLTLFLERLYVSRCSPEETDTIRKLFVELVREKAASMGALSVLAGEYSCCCESGEYARMGYYLYISKSKSGAQYLDSLSGPASVSKEGGYARGSFLVSQSVA